MLEQKRLLQCKVFGIFYSNFWGASSFRIAQIVWRITHFPLNDYCACLCFIDWHKEQGQVEERQSSWMWEHLSSFFVSFFVFSRGSLFSLVPHIQSFTLIFMPCLDEYFTFAGSWFWPNKLVSLSIANIKVFNLCQRIDALYCFLHLVWNLDQYYLSLCSVWLLTASICLTMANFTI